MKRVVCVLVFLAFALIPASREARADAPVVHDFVIDVEGTPADGIYVKPSGQPQKLIVVAHGYTHTTDSWRAHLVSMATRTGSLVVAMNYPTTFTGVGRGATETVAAVRFFTAKYPQINERYLFSVSMGNIVASIALAEHDVFDWWIDVEGVSNLFETWSEATALRHEAAPDIEHECGGTPATASTEYTRRSAALRAQEIAPKIRGVIVIHAPEDGLVPYNQSRELVTALDAVDVDVDFYSVVGRDCRLNKEGNTTIAGYAGTNPQCLAGHASERLSDHVIMRTAFAALAKLVAKTRVPAGVTEITVDEPYAPGGS